MTFTESASSQPDTPESSLPESPLSESPLPESPLPESPGPESSLPESVLVIPVAAVTALASAVSGVEPTGTGWWDGVLAAMLGIVVVVAATRSSPYAVIAAATIAAMAVGPTPWLVVAVLGLGFALAGAAYQAAEVPLRVASAGFTYVALLHLGNVKFFGSSALLAGLAIALVLFTSYARAGDTARSRVNSALSVFIVILGIILVIAAYQGVSIRSSANGGVQAARNGLESARAGDTQELSIQLERAQQLLADAEAKVNSPLLRPLALIPVAAQHLHALSTATEQGLVVANEALALSTEANLEELQLRAGQFDLDLLAQMEPRLVGAAASIEQTIQVINDERSPWLLPLIDSQIQGLADEAAAVLPETQVAAEAAAVLPQMLGANGERRYLMFFGSPGEAREFGGFIGGYALLSVVDGGLDLLRAGSINDLVDLASANGAELDDPLGYPSIFLGNEPALFPQNLTSSPNIELIARATRDVFPELDGAPIDGILYLDPFALAAMTTFTGPLSVEGFDQPLNESGLIDFIFDGQYRAFESRDERFGAIGALATATAAIFAGADLPGPEELGRVLGPAARAGRLQIATFDDRENEFLSSVQLQRTFGAPTDIDSFALTHSNGTASKLDLYLHRTLRYDVSVDASGELTAIVDVELRSDIPADIPPLTLGETDGTNEVLLSLYTPHELVDLSVNGGSHESVTDQEFGFLRHALFKIAIGPNEAANVRFTLRGAAPPGEYSVGVWSQPLVNADAVEIVYQPPVGGALRVAQELRQNWLVVPAGDGAPVE